MSQSLFQCYMHLVFSTKKRRAFFQEKGLRQEVFRYLHGSCSHLGHSPLIVNGYVEHAHILVRLGKKMTAPELVGEIKESSSKWIKNLGLDHFYWQPGYGGFSVSPTHVDAVYRYIANQELHHQTVDFEEEFIALLKKNRVDFDENHLWT
ncbi:MAG: transposase [Acidobacteria bacterium]|nr:transposase [Acidobacteriota bacterium]